MTTTSEQDLSMIHCWNDFVATTKRESPDFGEWDRRRQLQAFEDWVKDYYVEPLKAVDVSPWEPD